MCASKIQLKHNNRLYIYLFSLFSPIVIFFIFAIQKETAFFDYLIFGTGILLIVFVFFRSRMLVYAAKAKMELQKLDEKINLIQAGLIKDKEAVKAFKEKIVSFSDLKVVVEKLSLCLHQEDTTRVLAAEVSRLLGDTLSTVILYQLHAQTGELGISSSRKGQLRTNIKTKNGDVFDYWVVKKLQPLLIEDVRKDYRFDLHQVDEEETRRFRSLISVPLGVGNKTLGVLRLDSPEVKFFSMEDLRLLQALGGLGSMALENAQLYERFENLAIKDGLTNLYLRRYFEDALGMEINRHARRKKSLALVMIDLDHFKKYNDKFGHVAGDIVLRTVSGLLSNFFSEPGHLLCRYGGEEFCVVLPECSKKKAAILAQDVRECIAHQTMLLRREKTYVTASIGVATFPDDAQVKVELIRKADQALYQAKANGRDRVCLAYSH